MTAAQLVAHGIGDYVIQSDWMANEKTKRWFPALVHGLTYGLVFVWFTQEWWRLAVIILSHALIDRYRLIRFVIYAKNFLAPRDQWLAWSQCKGTGYHQDRPVWLAVWLMIIADNICHVLINDWVL